MQGTVISAIGCPLADTVKYVYAFVLKHYTVKLTLFREIIFLTNERNGISPG